MVLLIDQISSSQQLNEAWEKIKRKRDVTPGIDSVTVDAFSVNLRKNIHDISSKLKANEYVFDQVIQSKIPKSQTTTRSISIYSLKDKIVQKSIQLSLERKRGDGLYFPDTINSISVGFISSKLNSHNSIGVRRAVELVKEYYKKGYPILVTADIKNFFDVIDRGKLKKLILDKVAPDDSINWLLEQCLNPNSLEKDRFTGKTHIITTSSGVAQGSILSPLFSNIYLSNFDKAIESLGIPAIRYADDFAFFAKNQKEAEYTLQLISRKLMHESGLTFYPQGEKKEPKFYNLSNRFGQYLGIHFERRHNRWVIRPADKKIKELRYEVVASMHDHRIPLFTKISTLNSKLHSWVDTYRYIGCSLSPLKENFSQARVLYEKEMSDLFTRKKITKNKLTQSQLIFLGVLTKNKVMKKRKRGMVRRNF